MQREAVKQGRASERCGVQYPWQWHSAQYRYDADRRGGGVFESSFCS